MRHSRFNLSAFLFGRFNNVPKTRCSPEVHNDTICLLQKVLLKLSPKLFFSSSSWKTRRGLVETESTLVATSAVKAVSRIPNLGGRVITTVFASATRQLGSNRVGSRGSELEERVITTVLVSVAEQRVLCRDGLQKRGELWYSRLRGSCQQRLFHSEYVPLKISRTSESLGTVIQGRE